MEKTETQNKTINPPKTINEIVEDLRSRDELDEEKWNTIQEKKNVTIRILSLFTIILLVMTFTSGQFIPAALAWIVLAYICFIFFTRLKKEIRKKTYLHNYGVLTDAKLVSNKEFNTMSGKRVSHLEYQFFDGENIKHLGNDDFYYGHFNFAGSEQIGIGERSEPEIETIQKNQSLKVLYDKKNPESNCIYNLSGKKEFYLRKEDNYAN